MGLNMNYSLLLKETRTRFEIPIYQTPMLESYYLPSLHAINEMNDDIRKAQYELYHITQVEFVNEGNVLKTINDKIESIIIAILKGIKKIKDIILNAFNAFFAKWQKSKTKVDAKQIKDLYDQINEYYDNQIYITMNIYSNSLKQSLIDAKIPDPKAMFNHDDFDEMLNNINRDRHNEYGMTSDQIKTSLNIQREKMIQNRINARQALIGAKSISKNDLNDISMYKDQLYNYYIGNNNEMVITRNIVIKALDNLDDYPNIINKFMENKSSVEKMYNEIYKRVETFRKQANTELLNPSKYATGDPADVEKRITDLSKAAIALSDIVNGFLQDHMTACMTKLECLKKMQDQDQNVINNVIAKINKSVNEMAFIEKDTYDELDESLIKFCEGCFMLHELNGKYDLSNYINEVVMEADGDGKLGFKDNAERITNMIVQMFKKFMLSLNKIIGIDKKWFEQNEKTLKDAGFKFPNADQKIPDWVPYRSDLLEKSFEIPAFDMGNTQLMSELEDDEKFAKFIYTKIGGSESDIKSDEAKNGSFAIKCKAIYSGGGQKEVTVSELQKDKDRFFDYCKNYLDGENGGIYKSISKDTKALDESKKNVQRALKNHQTTTQQTDKATEEGKETKTTTSETPKSGTQGNDGTPSNQKAADTKQEAFGFDLDLSNLFKISESFLQELTTPNVEKNDKDAVKGNVSTGGGDSEDGLKSLKEKSNRFFTMFGNVLGAKMTASMQCYKQYKQLLRWALKSTEARQVENNDTVTKKEEPVSNNNESIEASAKK